MSIHFNNYHILLILIHTFYEYKFPVPEHLPAVRSLRYIFFTFLNSADPLESWNRKIQSHLHLTPPLTFHFPFYIKVASAKNVISLKIVYHTEFEDSEIFCNVLQKFSCLRSATTKMCPIPILGH